MGLPYDARAASVSAARIAKIEALADDPRGDAAMRAVARETLAKLKTGKLRKHDPALRPAQSRARDRRDSFLTLIRVSAI